MSVSTTATLAELPPAELRAWFCRENAARPNPWPVCPSCLWATHPGDMHDLVAGRCWSCGQIRLTELVGRLLHARGRHAVLAAAERICRLA